MTGPGDLTLRDLSLKCKRHVQMDDKVCQKRRRSANILLDVCRNSRGCPPAWCRLIWYLIRVRMAKVLSTYGETHACPRPSLHRVIQSSRALSRSEPSTWQCCHHLRRIELLHVLRPRLASRPQKAYRIHKDMLNDSEYSMSSLVMFICQRIHNANVMYFNLTLVYSANKII